MNNGRIHDRPRGDADAPALQILVHRVQHRPAQLVLLQQVTEPEDGALVRRRRAPQIDSHKVPQHRRFIQRILRPRIAQVEPLNVSESVVKNTLQQLFAKTEVRTRSQLVRVALECYRDLL